MKIRWQRSIRTSEIIASQTGDFTRAKGKEVMESFLKTYGSEIKGRLCAQRRYDARRDQEAIKEAGLKPGEDIKTVSCDGVKAIFEAMAAGEANVTIGVQPAARTGLLWRRRRSLQGRRNR